MIGRRAFTWLLPLAVAAFATSVVPWEDLTEADWLYKVATRFTQVDGHKVHYPTPTAELARLLEGRTDPGALRHLAEARMALGDRAGACATLERWAQGQTAQGAPDTLGAQGGLDARGVQGALAWAETARWEAAHQELAAAFRAAEKALPGLPAEDRRALSDQRIAWAQAHPDLADELALRKAKAELFPEDAQVLEDWLRALERAGRLDEAGRVLAEAKALPPERRLLVRSDLRADHGDAQGAFRILDEAVLKPWSNDFARAYAARVECGAPAAPAGWRATLEARYDAGALVRLFTYFAGGYKAGSALELLAQVERRHEKSLGRPDELLLSRLYASVDAVPEAFRAALAAAHLGTEAEQTGDLATLADLALRAGGRPLAWGTYNDEAYHWAAAVDRTPGFWSGGVSFLLTGVAWKETLERLESQSLGDRTFATARALASALAQRAPDHPSLVALRVAIMARHVQQGEGAAALALLPLVESGPAEVADQARAQALLAARQQAMPLAEEMRLMKARLAYAAPEGSRPDLKPEDHRVDYLPEEHGAVNAWTRLRTRTRSVGYAQLLNECIGRLDSRDRSHRPSVDLLLTELDRHPDDEALWLDLAGRLESWRLDDELGPRYQQALKRFQEPGVWDKAARWYARRGYHAELRALADDVTARFRGSELFGRAGADVVVQAPDQPPVGMAVRMVPWADWVRLRALERFPHSPQVFREAGRLVTPAQWQAHFNPAEEARKPSTRVIVPEALLEERRWAILFVDPAQREAWFAHAMEKGVLEAKLAALEARGDRTPVEDQLLFEGWARLSRFERALEPGERLCRSYPGDGDLAGRTLTLHRSLNGLESSHVAAARALVERAAPALENPGPLWTELGEMEEDRGRGEEAMKLWNNLLAREPRNPAKVAELATLLWDYNHDREALAVVEAGRKAMDRPRFYAFETGVLRENLHDLDGAVKEYLTATRQDAGDGSDSGFEGDQRSLRRLAQLLAKPRVYALVEARIKALAPGSAEDELTLEAYAPLGSITTPDPGQAWDADAWIDELDLPADSVGRARRQAQKEAGRPGQFDAIRRIGDLMLDKTRAMVPRATAPSFLDFAEGAPGLLTGERRPGDAAVPYKAAIMARRAELAQGEEARVRLDMERAEFLAAHGRAVEADEVWAALAPRLDQLPEGSVRLRAESRRAGYLERAKGVPAAAEEWRRITARHPWSLGLLEDRLAFLDRAGRGEEARALLEETVPRAAAGHWENLLERLTGESLAAGDLQRARRAVEQLLGREGMDDARRLGAVHLLARLSWREEPGWDPFPLARAQAALLKPEAQADLYHQLARAADLEQAGARGLALWIEALNRRTDRTWLDEAARATQHSGKGAELLAFFEKQRERSPRDVRWVVAVRDLRRYGRDVAGAVEAARAAVAVRPEDEKLWREAAEILVRADRLHEAADFLEGWNRPRPASEDVARWRSELYVRAGDGEKALAMEQNALQALSREHAVDPAEKTSRRVRAAQRLHHLGHPELAVRLFSPKGDASRLAAVRELPVADGAAIALRLGQFPRYAEACASREGGLAEAGALLVQQGRPEQKEELQAWLAATLWPAQAAGPDSTALNAWWPFITTSSLEPGLRAALAQRLVSTRPGPWQADPPFPFVRSVASELIRDFPSTFAQPAHRAFLEPDLARLWAADLTRRDRGEELLAFVEPRWQELLAQARGSAPLAAGTRQPWASWLDDRRALAAWARAAAVHPEKVRELSGLMAERRSWDRFWALAARGWAVETLLAILPEGPRDAWFRFWEPNLEDPVLLARRDLLRKVDTTVAGLVQGRAGAGDDALLERLRGPRTVGEVLGHDPRWLWTEFTPRRDGKGGLAEQGDDRVTGQGADQGRAPGAIWGERPGEAWFVLEALARYRKGDATAPWLPLEAGAPGAQTSRSLLAMRMARAMDNLPLALELAEARPGPAGDRAWLEGKLSLLKALGRGPEAAELFRNHLRARQPQMDEAEFRALAVMAARLGLPSPLDGLDPAQPVGPVFLAWLQDQHPEAARTFRTANPVDFRTALARRWHDKAGALTRGQAQYWLRELWATGSADLPPKVLARIGPVWASAGPWLLGRPDRGRLAALSALEQATDPANANPSLLAELTRPKAPDAHRLLAVRLRLARKEPEAALALVDTLVAELDAGTALSFDGAPVVEGAVADGAENGAGEEAGSGAGDGAEEGEQVGAEERSAHYGHGAMVDRLEAWLAPFRGTAQARSVEERFLKVLAARRQEGMAMLGPHAWRLAFQLSPPAEVPGLLRELEEAWFRGYVYPGHLGIILGAAAPAAPAVVDHWLARWPTHDTYAEARDRAALLAGLKRPGDALKALLAARAAGSWSAREETQAFDLWRRLGAAPGVKAPAYWTGSAAVWAGATPLGDRLKAHDHDVHAARAALRNLWPGDENGLMRALLVLETDRPWAGDLGGDAGVLRLRAARGLLPRSAAAAKAALALMGSDGLVRILARRAFKAADVNAALADVARIAARTGEDVEAARVLAVLSDRGAPGLQALQAELAPAPGKAEAFRMADGKPAPIRPRDLTWVLLAHVLDKEGTP